MSIIKHVTLQKIVAHDFRYDPRINITQMHHCVMLCYIYVSCLVVFDSVVRTVWYMSEDELHLEA